MNHSQVLFLVHPPADSHTHTNVPTITDACTCNQLQCLLPIVAEKSRTEDNNSPVLQYMSVVVLSPPFFCNTLGNKHFTHERWMNVIIFKCVFLCLFLL